MSNLVCPNCGGDLKPNGDGTFKCVFCGTQVSGGTKDNERFDRPALRQNQAEGRMPDVGRCLHLNLQPAYPEYNAPGNKSEEKFGLFSESDWEYGWRDKTKKDKGIILTDTSNLANKENFFCVIKRFIEFKKQSGVYYDMLDLASQVVMRGVKRDLKQIVELLKRIYKESVPNYLLIVGDWRVIPCALWDNEADDDDEVVPSDFVYTVLNCDSPFDGNEYDVENVTCVGRVPTSPDSNFAEAIKYFNNVMNFKPLSKTNGFAYSAHIWKDTSKEVFKNIAETINLSPRYICEPDKDCPDGVFLPRLDNYNLLGFNLHGSPANNRWYGQYQGIYPPAFKASLLPSKELGGYVLCAEACYGAKPTVNKDNADSILLTALQNNCMAFVGSSMIAYGLGDGRLCCADIIASEFLTLVNNGLTVGAAFNLALARLLENISDEEDIKTFAEFALYGDPSIVFCVSGVAKRGAFDFVAVKIAKTERNDSLARKLVPINEKMGFYDKKGQSYTKFCYNESENATVKKMACLINQKSFDHISSAYDDMKGVSPTVYKVLGTNEYRSVYSKTANGIKSVVRLHFNEYGDVIKTYISK